MKYIYSLVVVVVMLVGGCSSAGTTDPVVGNGNQIVFIYEVLGTEYRIDTRYDVPPVEEVLAEGYDFNQYYDPDLWNEPSGGNPYDHRIQLSEDSCIPQEIIDAGAAEDRIRVTIYNPYVSYPLAGYDDNGRVFSALPPRTKETFPPHRYLGPGNWEIDYVVSLIIEPEPDYDSRRVFSWRLRFSCDRLPSRG